MFDTSFRPPMMLCWLGFAVFSLALMALPSGWTNVAILTFLFIYFCIAWNLVGGIAGQFCIGHSLFIAAGAYTTVLLSTHLGVTPWIGMLAGALVAMAIGVFIAWLSFRYELPQLSFALVTIALAMLGFLGISSSTFLGASSGLTLPMHGTPAMYQFRSDSSYYLVIVAHVLVALALSMWLYHSKVGLYLRVIRDNERAAHAIGVPVLKYKMLAMAISAGLTALGGTFYAQYLQYVEPHTFAGLGIVIQIILLTVVGGSGTIWGPVIGPILLVPVGEVLRNMLGDAVPGVHTLVYGIFLIAVIRFAPNGLIGACTRMLQGLRFRREMKEATTQ
jgi:branched-chain amino acid transport system permease protein